MKNALFYYYQLNPTKIIKNKNYYSFEDNNYFYYLYPFNRPIAYLNELLTLSKTLINSKFMQIILNTNNQALSLINNNYYILLRKNKKVYFNISDICNPYYCNLEIQKLKLLNHSDWASLWSSKIDYFEYQKDYIRIKYPLLYKSLDYYIGLSEVAISYFNAINTMLKRGFNDNLVVSRRRINLEDNSFYNPLNIVIDNKARDVGNYLQYLFIRNNYNYDEIEIFISNLYYSKYQYSLLMDRLLFPSFYFDAYENIINGYDNEKKIMPILNRSLEYEKYLKTIYYIINKNQSIFNIDWFDN